VKTFTDLSTKLKDPVEIPNDDASNVTLGDMIASFLQERDTYTASLGQMPESFLRKVHWLHLRTQCGDGYGLVFPKEKRWFHAVSCRRWYGTYAW
jgi:hypothetical protein